MNLVDNVENTDLSCLNNEKNYHVVNSLNSCDEVWNTVNNIVNTNLVCLGNDTEKANDFVNDLDSMLKTLSNIGTTSLSYSTSCNVKGIVDNLNFYDDALNIVDNVENTDLSCLSNEKNNNVVNSLNSYDEGVLNNVNNVGNTDLACPSNAKNNNVENSLNLCDEVWNTTNNVGNTDLVCLGTDIEKANDFVNGGLNSSDGVLITVNNVATTGLSYSKNWNDKEVIDNSNLYHKVSRTVDNNESTSLPNLINENCNNIMENSDPYQEDFNYDSRSDYEYDSGSDYLPPSQIHCESMRSDDEVSLKSDINVNKCNDSDNESDNSSSIVGNKQLSVLNPKDTIASKNTKAGYNFSASVQCSRKKPIDNKRLWDKTDCCIFCEENITNFTRHIIRKHASEIEVARYLSFPQGSKDRKILSDQLRKRGNFLCNVGSEQVIKPLRRPNEFSTTSNAADYLPCKYCYGLYKKKYLYRHEKICKSVKTELKGRNKAQADAQNLLLTFTDTDEQLVKEVFPRMAVDSISLIAKTDSLIKSFGSRYLKCHREKHLVNIVSQKMRTLARLLIQMRNEDSNIKSLLDYLTPKYFDKIIKCTKIVAGYDAENDKFGSPSIVLKMGSALKQCCDIAEFNILKESKHLDLDDTQKKIKKSLLNMRSIIEKQWSYEISTNACKEIFQKKWNKPAYLPLTSDLKENSNNIKSYRELQESILSQLILLNRRRSGEVQRIFLQTYLCAPSEISQEEVDFSLSEVEKQLTKQFKRIIIRGKRGRGVPILFTTNMQKTIKFLLAIRETSSFIDKENPYLFALPNSMNSLRGSDAIRKLAKESGAKNPENLTSTKLRKQIATVAQLLNLSENDIEQLANFLGHTKDVHKHFYRLSESTFQVAKISKMLLMMEKGQGHEFRGKNLDEIDINVEALVSDEENED
uniref:Uncharacterized protein n=1 Tax=Acyrthosiphon pisum TaxID=7029 RepID=A0A8R2BAE1_ACYPI